MTRIRIRRTMTCCGAAALLLATAGAMPGARAPLALGVIVAEDDHAYRGIQLGAEEAAHTARLLRQPFTVHLEHAADAAAVHRLIDEYGVHAIIVATHTVHAGLAHIADSAGVLVLEIGSSQADDAASCSPLTFRVLPSTAMRAAALRLAAGDSAAAWHDSLERYGAGQLNDRFRARFGGSVTERAWAGWFAVKVLWEAAQRAAGMDATALGAYLTDSAASFDGHKGLPLSFHPRTGQLRQPLYILADGIVTADVPAVRAEPDLDPAALLDRLIDSDAEVSCAVR